MRPAEESTIKAQEMRNAARARWTASGITTSDLTAKHLQALRQKINDEMKASDAASGTLRCHQRFITDTDDDGKPYYDLRCRSNYFDARQVVTLEPSGFVGFAGWAGAEYIAPIITGFEAWLAELVDDRGREALHRAIAFY